MNNFSRLTFAAAIFSAAILNAHEILRATALQPEVPGQKTTFSLAADPETGIRFHADAEGESATFEIFFHTDSELPSSAYYQFYAELGGKTPRLVDKKFAPVCERLGIVPAEDMSFLCYYYFFDNLREKFPWLSGYRSHVEKTETGYAADLVIPWHALRKILPFTSDGKGKEWSLAFIRSDGEELQTWKNEKFHKVETWEKIKFPDFSAAEMKAVYAAVCKQARTTAAPVADFLYASDSIPAAKSAMFAELDKISAAADAEKCTLEELRELAEKSWDASLPLHLVAYYPLRPEANNGKDPVRGAWKKVTNSDGSLSYVCETPTSGDTYITKLNFAFRGKTDNKLYWETTGKTPRRGVIEKSAAYDNIPISADGFDTITFTVRDETGATPSGQFSCALESYRFGFKPLEKDSEITAARQNDGTICFHHLARHLQQCLDILRDTPAVMISGGSMLDGIGPTKSFAEKILAKGPAGDNAMVGSKHSSYMWRLKYGVLDAVPPKTVLFMMESRTPEECARATSDEIKMIREKAPNARIIILPLLPDKKADKPYKETAIFACNQELKKFADGKTIFFADFTDKFLDAAGMPISALYQGVFVTDEAYGFMLDAALPFFVW